MTQQTAKTARRSYIDLAEALKARKEAASDQQIWDALQSVPVTEEAYREILHAADVFVLLEDEDYLSLAKGLSLAMKDLPDFDPERFLAHALSVPTGKSDRRAFVDLSEAVRTVNGPSGLRDMLMAIAGLNLTEEARQTVLTTFLANTPHRWGFSDVHRENLANALARLLEGQPKFNGARFIYHAVSDSAADDDSGQGKWSYNQNAPEEALKVTIEATED
jgi:hypothetical protein